MLSARARIGLVSALATAIAADIEARRLDVARLCAQFGVRRLELFGSAVKGGFDAARSDLDFLIEFNASPRLTPFEQYFGMKESLEALFGRTVDLVMAGASQNPYFLKSLNESRSLLYAA
mgnify:CR=1 FL=1